MLAVRVTASPAPASLPIPGARVPGSQNRPRAAGPGREHTAGTRPGTAAGRRPTRPDRPPEPGVSAGPRPAARAPTALNPILGRVTPKPDIRHCVSTADFDACVQLQQATWGETYRDIVPASLLKVSRRVGGIVAGAFAGPELVGFVYGLTGPDRDGRLLHWSHMLGVRADWRDRGIGRALKAFQRSALRGSGVATIAWTFDPLVARNAHLNLNRLGARIAEYVPDMYAETGSTLHAFGTDRLVVEWPVEPAPGTPAAVTTAAAAALRIEIPADIEGIAHRDIGQARAWRQAVRAAFLDAVGRGCAVTGFERTDAGCFYLLHPQSGEVRT